jgi:hypothetical protein
VGGLASQVVDDFHVLPASVEDLQHVLIVDQQVEQRRHVDVLGQRVDRRRFSTIGDLDQAQFGPIGVLAHEFGVNAHEVCLGEPGTEVRKRCGRRNQRMYFHRSFLVLTPCEVAASIESQPSPTGCNRAPAPIAQRWKGWGNGNPRHHILTLCG